jgi:SSS family solute:Na+ symporter
MTFLDWAIVLLLNGAIVVYGLLRSRETHTAADWFLAGRSLPWWIVGLSLWATAIDSSDLVADAGYVFQGGVTYFVTNWVGGVVGWVVAAHLVVLPMYRAGMYTNAEYLEARFGPAARVISALVQVQYRTLVLGIMAKTMYLVFAVVCGWEPAAAWSAVVVLALLASLYTALGGLKSVAVTDALQTVIMVAAGFTLFWLAWDQVEGWNGLQERLDASRAGLAAELLRVGTPSPDVPSVLWGCLAFFVMGFAYSIVNHTQSMRLFASRSEWDLKMAVVPAAVLIITMTFVNLMVGIMGRAIYPETSAMPVDLELQSRDSIYPVLIRDLATTGLRGLIVGGVVASILSTFDSIGSTLSSLLVRDVYARLIKRDGDDAHYLRLGRWLTPVIIFGSFLYVPFMGEEGMLNFYLSLVSAFVVPLLTVYLLGTLTGVNRKTGTLGLVVGVAYGLLRLSLEGGGADNPLGTMHQSYVLTMVATCLPMVVLSSFLGWEKRGELRYEEQAGWLRESQRLASESAAPSVGTRSSVVPIILGLLVIALGAVLSFVVFW